MPFFKKKPVTIEAIQWDGTSKSASDICAWSNGRLSWRVLGANIVDGINVLNIGLFVHTLEGTMQTQPNDWIIKGVAGEFYPCKSSIFAETYEAVE